MKNRGRNKPPLTAWKPGTSGNPAGRPKGSGTLEIIAFARRLSLKTMRKLERIVDADDTDARVLAAIGRLAIEASKLPDAEAPPPQVIRFEFSGDWTAPSGADETGIVVEVPEGGPVSSSAREGNA